MCGSVAEWLWRRFRKPLGSPASVQVRSLSLFLFFPFFTFFTFRFPLFTFHFPLVPSLPFLSLLLLLPLPRPLLLLLRLCTLPSFLLCSPHCRPLSTHPARHYCPHTRPLPFTHTAPGTPAPYTYTYTYTRRHMSTPAHTYPHARTHTRIQPRTHPRPQPSP